jgi:hypothetical protein
MALTRAQLLMGDVAQGTVLSGEAQGVRPGGNGITIRTDGVIEVNSQTIIGVMKLGQNAISAAAAYNGYEWPAATGSPGQQITIQSVAAGITTLAWDDPDQIPWTAKGQLVVGTGVNTQTILNVGGNTSFLMADSTTASGLIYSNSVTSAMQAPAGTTAQRPSPASAGQLRYNTTTGKFELYTGTDWEEIASGQPVPGGNTFVKQSIPTNVAQTGNALIPSGTTAQRQTAPALTAGSTRFNTTLNTMETWDGTTWGPTGGFSVGTRLVFVQATAPTGWVKETGAAYNDAALRFVTGGSGNSTAGANPFTSSFTNYTPSGSIAATTANTTAGGTVTGNNATTTATGTVTGTVGNTTASGTVTGTNANTTAGGSVTGSVGATTLTIAEMPSHAHAPLNILGSAFTGFVVDNGNNSPPFRSILSDPSYTTTYSVPGTTDYTGGNGAHSHTLTAATFTGTPHSHTWSGAFTGAAHSHTWNGTFTGVAHDHVWTGSFAGAAHNHTVAGTFTGNTSSQFAVKYVDTIICTKT